MHRTKAVAWSERISIEDAITTIIVIADIIMITTTTITIIRRSFLGRKPVGSSRRNATKSYINVPISATRNKTTSRTSTPTNGTLASIPTSSCPTIGTD